MSDQIPKTCKAAVFEEAGKDLVIKDVDVPQPEKGQVLIKVVRNNCRLSTTKRVAMMCKN